MATQLPNTLKHQAAQQAQQAAQAQPSQSAPSTPSFPSTPAGVPTAPTVTTVPPVASTEAAMSKVIAQDGVQDGAQNSAQDGTINVEPTGTQTINIPTTAPLAELTPPSNAPAPGALQVYNPFLRGNELAFIVAQTIYERLSQNPNFSPDTLHQVPVLNIQLGVELFDIAVGPDPIARFNTPKLSIDVRNDSVDSIRERFKLPAPVLQA